MTRIAISGDEQQAFSRIGRKAKKNWKPGELHRIKRGANRRERRAGRVEARLEAWI